MMETSILNRYKNRLKCYINSIDSDEVVRIASVIKQAIDDNKTIFVVGNGGSMATAIHFAEDLMLGNKFKTKVMCLNNVSVLTAISNDYTYEQVFEKQLVNLMEKGDILITISCSGASPNLKRAIGHVKKLGGTTISISGFHGGDTKRKSDYSIYARTEVGDYEATEDLHYIICHMIARLIKEMDYED